MISDATIIGGGVAGTAIASVLADEGLKVTIIERERIAAGGSGNALGLVTPYITKEKNLSHLHETATELLAEHCEEIGLKKAWNQVLQLPSSDRLDKIHGELPQHLLPLIDSLSIQEASELCGISLQHKALLYKNGFVISPRELCHARLKASSIKTITECNAIELGNPDGAWHVINSKNDLVSQSKFVVIANAFDGSQFEQTSMLPLEAVRGQLCYASQNESSQKLRIPLCYDGYIFPTQDGTHLIGASYDHNDLSREVSADKTKDMLNRLKKWTALDLHESPQHGRVSFRASTFDRLPYVGEVNGVYVAVGFGSKGISLSLLSAMILRDIIFEQQSALRTDFEAILTVKRALESTKRIDKYRSKQLGSSPNR